MLEFKFIVGFLKEIGALNFTVVCLFFNTPGVIFTLIYTGLVRTKIDTSYLKALEPLNKDLSDLTEAVNSLKETVIRNNEQLKIVFGNKK